MVIVIAWYSTYVVEPVVQSVILVERSPVTEATERAEEINSSTVEEVRQAVTQFLQQQQSTETSHQQQDQPICRSLDYTNSNPIIKLKHN